MSVVGLILNNHEDFTGCFVKIGLLPDDFFRSMLSGEII